MIAALLQPRSTIQLQGKCEFYLMYMREEKDVVGMKLGSSTPVLIKLSGTFSYFIRSVNGHWGLELLLKSLVTIVKLICCIHRFSIGYQFKTPS